MIDLRHGDCLELMRDIPDGSIDAIISDPPYGRTSCTWDTVIPFVPMWEHLKRIIKPKGAIVLFGIQPFTSALINSNVAEFKYCWYWCKSKPNGWQNSKNRPMRAIEEVAVFSQSPMGHVTLLGDRRMTYFPQGITSMGINTIKDYTHGRTMGKRPNQVGIRYESFTGFPNDVLCFPNIIGKAAIHPTQKPVALMAYLVKTYTNDGETVLDFCAGSASTGVACIETGRSFIGIEKDATYFAVAEERLADAAAKLHQLELVV